MAFADPQSITINAVAQSLPRVSVGPNASVYQKDDASYKETVSHQYGKRTRRSLRLDYTITAADPLITGTNRTYSMSAYLVVDVPPSGFTIAAQKLQVDGLLAYLSASSGAKVTQLLGGEN